MSFFFFGLSVFNNRNLLSGGSGGGARSSRSKLQQGMKENVFHVSLLASGGLLEITDDVLASAASPQSLPSSSHACLCAYLRLSFSFLRKPLMIVE